jgi:acetyltransferase-like isoleucine patch superfamily enzyme
MPSLTPFLRALARRIIPGPLRTAWVRYQNPAIAKSAYLYRREDIDIGTGARIDQYAVLKSDGGKIVIGEKSLVGAFNVIIGTFNVTIGKNVMIGPHTIIVSGNHDFLQNRTPMRESSIISKGPIIIEEDVWIGANCVICDGVTVATGCVIGAGAVVTRSTEPCAVYAGVPAKKIRSRRNQ